MKTIVISDIHLGIDDKIAETVKNRPLLIDFLNDIRRSRSADEVVINGDFLDQWFLPAAYEAEADSDKFYLACAKNNQEVIDAFKALIDAGIRVVYVPGNHDMTLTQGTLNKIIPGITQARDVRGLGRYRTGYRGEIVIEHCHRYESFCAPDMLSNKEFMEYGEPILPPGYFFARIGVQSIVEGMPNIKKTLKDPAPPDKSYIRQILAYAYYKVWKTVIEDRFPVNEGLEEKFIKVAVDGFKGEFSLLDIIPKDTKEGISANLYKGFETHWEKLCRRNLVPAPVNLLEQLSRMTDQSLRAEYAKAQYFDLDPTVDVVVFGHTHVPYYEEYTEGYDRKKVYVNEGTWVDHNMDDPENTAVFAEITSHEKETTVLLKKCVAKDEGYDIEEVKL